MINIHAVNEVNDQLVLNFSVLEDCCRTVMRDHDQTRGDVTFIFTTDDVLNKLKIKFFDEDVLTDVIAFNLEEDDEPVEGEIYISWDRAKENAEIYEQPVNSELKRLAIHATLHLLGFEDTTEKEQKEMRSLEEKYLNQITGSIIK
ncbi:MAG: rRNA maturation RNase YbeY [FCB group bacterium]|nr:rRNA maturation RNase YbeY [FCB group bacterium]